MRLGTQVVGQKGGGHWSPIAAYNETADMALMLDTARRYGHYWAPVEVFSLHETAAVVVVPTRFRLAFERADCAWQGLCDAMRTRNVYGESRGWVVVHMP